MARKNTYVDGVKMVPGRNWVKRFYLRFYDVDGKQKQIAAKGCKDEITARTMLGGILKRVRDGLPGVAVPTEEQIEQGAITVEQLAQKFRKGYASPKVRDTDAYRTQSWSVIKCHILPTLGSRVAASVRRLDVENLRDAMQLAGKSPRMIQKTIVQLSCLYRWAAAKEHIACANPATGVDKPAAPQSTDVYSDEEVGRLFTWAATNDHQLYDLIALAFYGGCRLGELAALRWEDVDLVNLRLYVKRSWKSNTRKNGKEVIIPIHPRLEAVLRRRAAVAHKPGDLVFTSKRGKMLPRYRTWGLDKAIKATGVRSFKHPWHAFRHAHGTALAIRGAGLTEIRDALGQSSTAVAQRYVNIAADNRAKHVNAMPTPGADSPASNVVNLDDARQDKKQDKVDYSDSEVSANS